ncbi:MAG TPA: hypothetical protein VJJ52_06010 [Candidatus Nanoarchaeia archaeon]|nr:hypothetical protein [Candidatus Nanoarchaeia archaeon]
MKNKRASESTIWLVVVIALLLLFFLIYSGVLGKLYNKIFSGTSKQIDSTNDDDNDGVANFMDKCPGTDTGEPADQSGCSSGQKENKNPLI